MVYPNFAIRRGEASDLDAIATIFTASKTAMEFLPFRRSAAEDRDFIRNLIAREPVVLLACHLHRPVAVLAQEGIQILMLYTQPEWRGEGAGTALMNAAKEGRARLELLCFEANTVARCFYERHGFRAFGRSDGAENDERLPVIHYRWQRRG